MLDSRDEVIAAKALMLDSRDEVIAAKALMLINERQMLAVRRDRIEKRLCEIDLLMWNEINRKVKYAG